jgi:hypothetical protein
MRSLRTCIVIIMMKSRRMTLTVLIARMEKRNAYRIFVGKSEVKRSF